MRGVRRGLLLIKIKRSILQITPGRYVELSRMCEVGCAKNVFARLRGGGRVGAAFAAGVRCFSHSKRERRAQGVIS